MSGTLCARQDVDSAWKALTHINDLIRVADTKAGAVLAASGVLAGLELNAVSSTGARAGNPWYLPLLILSCVLAGTAGFAALSVLTPRITGGHGHSGVFFSDIRKNYRDPRTYLTRFRKLMDKDNGADLVAELGEQVWANSRVAASKFKRVRWALRVLEVALLLAGATLVASRG